MEPVKSLQQQAFPDGECFGCGPANPAGLRINSYADAEGNMSGEWTPRPEHGNGAGAICGGILGSLLDCHAAAAAGHALSEQAGEQTFGVTKEFTIEFLRPTPMQTIRLFATVVELRARSAAVDGTVEADGQVCCRFRGVFVVPRPATTG